VFKEVRFQGRVCFQGKQHVFSGLAYEGTFFGCLVFFAVVSRFVNIFCTVRRHLCQRGLLRSDGGDRCHARSAIESSAR
jgi:hypothetical protein